MHLILLFSSLAKHRVWGFQLDFVVMGVEWVEGGRGAVEDVSGGPCGEGLCGDGGMFQVKVV